VTVFMSAQNMDSYLSLRTSGGITLAQNDDVDGGGQLDARISRIELPQDGNYVIVASSFRSGSYGPYRLMLFKEDE
jgi:hypothetical protein